MEPLSPYETKLETTRPPLLVRPTGKAKSKRTENDYFTFDLVKPKGPASDRTQKKKRKSKE